MMGIFKLWLCRKSIYKLLIYKVHQFIVSSFIDISRLRSPELKPIYGCTRVKLNPIVNSFTKLGIEMLN